MTRILPFIICIKHFRLHSGPNGKTIDSFGMDLSMDTFICGGTKTLGHFTTPYKSSEPLELKPRIAEGKYLNQIL